MSSKRGSSNRKNKFNNEIAWLMIYLLLLSQNLSQETDATTTMDYDSQEQYYEKESDHSNFDQAFNGETYDVASVNESTDMDHKYLEPYIPRIDLPPINTISRDDVNQHEFQSTELDSQKNLNTKDRRRPEFEYAMNADNFSQETAVINTELPMIRTTTTATTTIEPVGTLAFTLEQNTQTRTDQTPRKISSEIYEDNSKFNYQENENINQSLYTKSKEDDIMLFAMKFYQTIDDKTENPWNNLQPLPEAMPLLQQKILSGQQLQKQFPNNSEEGYLYQDVLEENLDHFDEDQRKNTMDQTSTETMIDLSDFTTMAATITTTETKTATAAIGSKEVKKMSTATATTTAAMATTEAPLSPLARPTPVYAGIGNKQSKQIIITQRKLLPYEQLRDYVEDAYIRMPLAVIVDPSAESLQKTKVIWNDAMHTNLNIKIILIALNASGPPAAYNFNNTGQFLNALNSIKENEGGDSFVGIVHASDLVPYDSAVFLSTTAIPRHTELVQNAAITLLKKRIRLYVIWFGERSISENEAQEAVGGLLGEVALRSGGEVLHIVNNENSKESESNRNTFVTDVLRRSQESDISSTVDTTLSTESVRIDAPLRSFTLDTANGDNFIKRRSIYFPNEIPSYNNITSPQKRGGINTHAKLRFPDDTKSQENPKSEVEIFSVEEIDNFHYMDQPIKNYTILETVDDNKGHTVKDDRFTIIPQSLTRIEMGTESQVLVTPGKETQLYFEISNSRTEAIFHNIQVVDEKRYLLRLSHQSVFLPPGATTSVTVTLLIPIGVPRSTIDRITFTCYGSQTVSLSVNIKLENYQDVEDTTEPIISWSFISQCKNIMSDESSCSYHFWAVNILAQDWQTGILRLETKPRSALFYQTTYTVGSIEPIRATYVASCCYPKVSLLIYDVAKNRKLETIDSGGLIIDDYTIATISLGVLVLILLIILIVLSVCLCRKREETLDFPTYRSHCRNLE